MMIREFVIGNITGNKSLVSVEDKETVNDHSGSRNRGAGRRPCTSYVKHRSWLRTAATTLSQFDTGAVASKLAEADIVLVQGSRPESDYRFKHALIQDAAYENLLKSRRQSMDRRAREGSVGSF
jgi:hypothetical protein